MIKYTILYKNGKTWNGKATHLRNISCVDCHVMVITYPYMTNSVRTDVLVPQELLPSCPGWVLKHFSIKKVEPKKVRQPNPKSKTKKQKAFDKDYNDWATRVVLSGQCTDKEEWSIKAYNKWLHEQKQEKHLTEVAGALPEYKIVLYTTNTDKQDNDGWITWNGGLRPVVPDTKIEIKFRGGNKTSVTDKPQSYDWRHFGEFYDIVAYKLYEEVSPDEPQNTTFPSGATISWDGIYQPCKESAISKYKISLADGSSLEFDVTNETVQSLVKKMNPIKTTYTFWLGVFGDISDDN